MALLLTLCDAAPPAFCGQGLTLGVNAIELSHRDIWYYNGVKTGNKVELAAAISSTSNWQLNWHRNK